MGREECLPRAGAEEATRGAVAHLHAVDGGVQGALHRLHVGPAGVAAVHVAVKLGQLRVKPLNRAPQLLLARPHIQLQHGGGGALPALPDALFPQAAAQEEPLLAARPLEVRARTDRPALASQFGLVFRKVCVLYPKFANISVFLRGKTTYFVNFINSGRILPL